MRILLIILLSLNLYAKTRTISPISPAKVIYINLNPISCDNDCLNNMLKKQMYLSYLTRFDPDYIKDKKLTSIYFQLLNNIEQYDTSKKIKVAVLIPQDVIKSYSKVVYNAIISYAIKTDSNMIFKFIQTNDESIENIEKSLKKARSLDIKYFISAFTQAGVMNLQSLVNPSEFIYVPTLHSSLLPSLSDNFLFGGIDYKEQIRSLIPLAKNKISSFSDNSYLGNFLNKSVAEISTLKSTQIEIEDKDFKLKEYLSNNFKVNNSSIFLNLPILKASILTTQLKTYELHPKMLLSTQINYNPKFLSLVKDKDRREFYVANSITGIDDDLNSINALMGEELNYNWLGYSCSIGIDYLQNALYPQKQRLFNEPIKDSQINYSIEILKSDKDQFVPILDKNDTNSSLILQGLE